LRPRRRPTRRSSDLREPQRVRKILGVTGQYASVDENLTAAENLWLFGRLQGLPGSDARTRAEELLEQFNLQDAADKRISQFSGRSEEHTSELSHVSI